MRAECEGNATAKARGQGAGGRGQRARGEQPSQKRKRALAQKATQQHETTLKPPRLFSFAPFGEASDPLAPCPDPLPPSSLLFRLHPLASACIGFSSFASACIGLQPLRHPLRVGVSGCRVGVSGRGCRVGVSGRGVGSPPAPPPPPCAQTKKAWYRKPCFLYIDFPPITLNRVVLALSCRSVPISEYYHRPCSLISSSFLTPYNRVSWSIVSAFFASLQHSI